MDQPDATTRTSTERRRSAAKHSEVTCERCGLYGLCLLAGLKSTESKLIDQVVSRRKPVAKDRYLYRAGDPFRGMFAVKTGAFKACMETGEHADHIVDFHVAGELIGLEAIETGYYAHSVIAMESSSVCELDLDAVPFAGAQMQEFQSELIHTMSSKILHSQWLSTLIGTRSAEQRVAAFLVYLSARFSNRGLPSLEFRLPMSREEIADYLGLALETVSRMFKRFQGRDLLTARGRQTQIHNLNGLQDVAGVYPLYRRS